MGYMCIELLYLQAIHSFYNWSFLYTQKLNLNTPLPPCQYNLPCLYCLNLVSWNVWCLLLLLVQVTYLALTRPQRFNYQAGDYVFLKIPSIAKTEWHPFTISSSPEQDFIGLHIRAVGTWTKKLYELIEKRNKTLNKALDSATARQEVVEIELPVVTESQLDDQSAGMSFDAEAK